MITDMLTALLALTVYNPPVAYFFGTFALLVALTSLWKVVR